jgi:hypothetical protein
VFVFLASGFGAARWRKAWTDGRLPGMCDPLPYGYFYAANESWSIGYSEDRAESPLSRIIRKGTQKILGFDVIHAWYNRKELADANVIWTHTEREYLAVLFLWGFSRLKKRPRMIAQSVWLFDRWAGYSALRRGLYRRLIRSADIMTVLSPENLNEARRLFPDKRCE